MAASSQLFIAFLTAAPLSFQASESPPDGTPIDFSRDVKPILSDKCFHCHGPDPQTREAGLRLDTREGILESHASGGRAVVPGNLDQSEMVYRIETDFEFDRMPPERSGKSLSEDEVKTLKRWIEGGAEWGDHWSFTPPVKLDLSAQGDRAIDFLVEEKLKDAGLTLQPEAAPETLLRRASLDLTGLPPTPEERSVFLEAVATRGLEGAYGSAVDRLIASPRYGVHMARTWLDAARYADTHGLHLDNQRSMWPYRDWVVNALNSGMPFDQFTVEQLAGDLLPNATLEQQIASGFNRCNPTSAEGGMIAKEYLSIYAKDRADTTATVWLGLTLACAQCHDHKYDPITQRDYYSMYAFFNSLDEDASDGNINNPKPFIRVASPEDTAELEAMAVRQADLLTEETRERPDLDARQAEWIAERGDAVRSSWKTLVPESAEASQGATLAIDPATGVVTASGENPDKTVYTVDAWIPPGAIEGLRLDALTPEGQTLPGRTPSNQNFVLSHVEVEAAPTGQRDRMQPIAIRSAAASHSQSNYSIEGILDPNPANGWAGLGLNGDRFALLGLGQRVGFAGGTELRIKLHFTSVHKKHSFAKFRLAVRRSDTPAAAIAFGDWLRADYPAASAAGLFEKPFGPELELKKQASDPIQWTAAEGLSAAAIYPLPSGVGAFYLKAPVHSDRRVTVDLKFGSDDGIVVWLNGQQVHSNNAARAATLDQDTQAVTLEEGKNSLLVKVVNTGGLGGFGYRVVEVPGDGFPLGLEVALLADSGDLKGAEKEELTRLWRRRFAPDWADVETARLALQIERAAFEQTFPTTMVSRSLAMPRTANVQMRGAYDSVGDEVTPATPSALPGLRKGAPRDRLGLAQWLVARENPLTARVWVNRAWQHFFGLGLVATPEDFGAQGAWPSHPRLLDDLSVEFMESGWDMKAMHRRIAMSQAYRQDSKVTPERLEADPDGSLISRGPRHRLDGEVLRDQALFAAGLLDETSGGPGVRPYQPDGVWFAVGYTRSNTVRYSQGPMDHLHRRSLYTFWKRTAPPPNLTTFDAPMRDACTVKRERTNTPLQALITLNDPTYVEAARFLAQRILKEEGLSREQRVDALFLYLAGRGAETHEQAALSQLVTDLTVSYRGEPEAARALLMVGDKPSDPELDPAEHAAWTLAASAVLNLDDVLTKN